MSINDIISLVLKVVCFILVAFVIPVIKNKYSDQKLKEVNEKIKMYVEAAEQIFNIEQGAEKKKWVQERLTAAGIDVNLEAIDAELERLVLEVHAAFRK